MWLWSKINNNHLGDLSYLHCVGEKISVPHTGLLCGQTEPTARVPGQWWGYSLPWNDDTIGEMSGVLFSFALRVMYNDVRFEGEGGPVFLV